MYQEFHIVELPKFTKTIDQLNSDIDEWLFFMNNADEFEKIPYQMKGSKKLEEAFRILERMSWTERDLDAYLAEADAAGYLDRVVDGAIERGIERGRQAEKEKIIINLYKKNIDINVIAETTGISTEEIQAICKK